MFNRKLKEKVEKLYLCIENIVSDNHKDQVQKYNLEFKVTLLEKEINKLEWRLNNPPKYKVGQKVSIAKVIKIEVIEETERISEIIWQIKKYKYTLEHPKLGTITKIE